MQHQIVSNLLVKNEQFDKIERYLLKILFYSEFYVELCYTLKKGR